MPTGIYKRTKKMRKSISIGMKGMLPWNTGLTKETSAVIKRYGRKSSKSLRGRKILWAKKIGDALRGKKKSKSHCKNIGLSGKGRIPWNKHRKNCVCERCKKKRNEFIYTPSPINPNKAEKSLFTTICNIINCIYPNEYRLNVDGKIKIGRLTPDIINVNGQKKIIELFGDYWHANPRIYKANDIVHHNYKAHHIWKHDKQRLQRYAKHGYQCLIIWESELQNKKTNVVKKIVNFHFHK